MREPSEDQIVQKAKTLAHEDGLLWQHSDLEESALDPDKPVMDDAQKAEYLNRARELLRREGVQA